jgi:hypothetical protein
MTANLAVHSSLRDGISDALSCDLSCDSHGRSAARARRAMGRPARRFARVRVPARVALCCNILRVPRCYTDRASTRPNNRYVPAVVQRIPRVFRCLCVGQTSIA